MNLESQKVIDRVVGGMLLVLLKPFVVALGFVLKRDHRLKVSGDITVMKMLGGGSLVIALPALLGLRRCHPSSKLRLITTTGIATFARSLGIFDEIIEIDQRSALRLGVSSVRALARSFRSDAFLDLEVYSRLTTVFSVLTCSRNRLGFYLESVVWRKPIHTHLIFFNRSAPVHLFYERMVSLFGATPASHEECAAHVLRALGGRPVATPESNASQIILGTGCSNLSPERMFRPEEWLLVFKSRLAADPALASAELVFLGAGSDWATAEATIDLLRKEWPQLKTENLCGKLKLSDSLLKIAGARNFWGIDSSLLHYARLFGLHCVSYWGPTSPEALLKPYPIKEEVHYRRIPCSPCVHVAEFAPCGGRNLCMTAHVRQLTDDELKKQLPVISNLPLE